MRPIRSPSASASSRPALHLALVDLADAAFGGARRLGRHLHQRHFQPGIGQRDGDAGAHGAAADHAAALHRAASHFLAVARRHAGGHPFGMEQVAQRPASAGPARNSSEAAVSRASPRRTAGRSPSPPPRPRPPGRWRRVPGAPPPPPPHRRRRAPPARPCPAPSGRAPSAACRVPPCRAPAPSPPGAGRWRSRPPARASAPRRPARGGRWSTISSAAIAPASRGVRWVPPAPGISPIRLSGRPTQPSGAMTRAWQASASSNPAPSAVPCSAATKGLPAASMAAFTSPGGDRPAAARRTRGYPPRPRRFARRRPAPPRAPPCRAATSATARQQLLAERIAEEVHRRMVDDDDGPRRRAVRC